MQIVRRPDNKYDIVDLTKDEIEDLSGIAAFSNLPVSHQLSLELENEDSLLYMDEIVDGLTLKVSEEDIVAIRSGYFEATGTIERSSYDR